MNKLTPHRLGAAGGSYENLFLASTLWDAFTCFFMMCVWLRWRVFSAPPVHPQAQVCYSSSCEGTSLGIPVLVIINTHIYTLFMFSAINKLEKKAIYFSLGLTSFSTIPIKVFPVLEVRKSYWYRLPKESSTVSQMEHSEVGLKCPHSIISIKRGDNNPGIWLSLSVSITVPEQNYSFGDIISTYGKIFYHVHMACSLWT